MSFDKSFFKQMGKRVQKEIRDYKAKSEEKPIEFRKCRHKNAKVINGQLRCSCGAAWRGPRLIDLLNLLGEKHDKDK